MMQLGVAVGGLIFLVGYLAAPYVLLSLIRALYYSFPAILTIQFILSAGLMILATLCMVSIRFSRWRSRNRRNVCGI